MEKPPEKIVVLGGGMSALTAAFNLARQRNTDGTPRYDLTVYQIGWRLGGKGASGRNTDKQLRIEEHGLHIWFGAYHNAFSTMQTVYAQCPDKWPCSIVKASHPARSEEWPWRSIEVAFRRQKDVHITEKRSRGWVPWHFEFPKSAAVPGSGSTRDSIGLVRGVQDWLAEHLAGSILFNHVRPRIEPLNLLVKLNPFNALLEPATLRKFASIGNLQTMDAVELRELAHRYEAFAVNLERWVSWAVLTADATLAHVPGHASVASAVDSIRRFWELFDLGQAVVRGALLDGVVTANDWDVINDQDWRSWLGRFVLDRSTLKSAAVEANYDLFFSYPRGNTDLGSLEAGTASRAALWILLTYQGSIMWRMNAGMGDVIFAPLYNALKALGVKFRFFHKVKSFGLNGDKQSVATITMEKQAHVSAGEESYSPFVLAPDGTECWPNRPDFGQLAQGVDLEQNWDDFNLESDWSAWRGGGSVTLEAGRDFDKIVSGIPVAALATICHELSADPKNEPFRKMLATVQTVETAAVQLWLAEDLEKLKCPLLGDPPVLTTFVNPLDTYSDMTYLVGAERWPVAPRHIAYFCGVLADEVSLVPSRDDPAFPKRVTQNVKDLAVRMLEREMHVLWPGAYTGADGKFRWDILCGGVGSGKDRLDDQFFHANIDASERYVLAVPGSSRHRLRADGAGYRNLFLAGDWTANGLYVGCIEGAVISGMQAARALSGQPLNIWGEGLLFPAARRAV